MNFTIQNDLNSQPKRLSWLINKLELTPYQLSKELNYKSPASIYHILKNIKKINNSFSNRLKLYNPTINTDWLITGWGDPFIHKYEFKEIVSSNSKIIYPARLDFFNIKKIAILFSKIIFTTPDDENFSIKVRKCGVEGLEFIYTTYNYYENQKSKDRYYTIIIQPDWRITFHFDFWRVEEITRRCENLLNISHKIEQYFQNSISEFLVFLDKNYSAANIGNEEIESLFSCEEIESNYIEILRTDCR